MPLINKLKAIANAIRSKTETDKLMTLDEMATEIEGISLSKILEEFLDVKGLENLFGKHSSRTNDELQILLSFITQYYTLYNTSNMFSNCTNLTSIPELDTSNVTDMSDMFYCCTNLTSIPELDTSKVTNMGNMFGRCLELTSIPLLNTSKVTNMGSMFSGCSKLVSIPELDTSNVTYMNSMLMNCVSLTSIPELDTSNVTDMGYMFARCLELTSIPELDTSNITNAGNTFYNCKSLTTCLLKNIKVNLTVGSDSSYGHLLTVESLLHLIQELINVDASRTLTIGTTNLAKINTTYVKLVDITDEMRAEDPYVDQKLPFEICESTDEGAMLLTTEYAKLKNWSVK